MGDTSQKCRAIRLYSAAKGLFSNKKINLQLNIFFWGVGKTSGGGGVGGSWWKVLEYEIISEMQLKFVKGPPALPCTC